MAPLLAKTVPDYRGKFLKNLANYLPDAQARNQQLSAQEHESFTGLLELQNMSTPQTRKDIPDMLDKVQDLKLSPLGQNLDFIRDVEVLVEHFINHTASPIIQPIIYIAVRPCDAPYDQVYWQPINGCASIVFQYPNTFVVYQKGTLQDYEAEFAADPLSLPHNILFKSGPLRPWTR